MFENRKLDYAMIILLTCFIFILMQFIVPSKNNLEKEFRNSEVLICYGTLIVTDSNWSLSGNHLINNNSAGYVNINQCSLKDK